jgi:UDP-N-acetylmuramoyl-tripeptide--D-alanyl-D-alanine ligase
LNGDDPFLKAKGDRIMTFGLRKGQVKAKSLRSNDWGTHFTLTAGSQRASTRLQMPGTHNVVNALAAVSAGLALGVPLKTLAKRLSTFKPRAKMRMELKKARGVLFLNDAYNASPTSMEAALETFKKLTAPKRKAAVLGDMLEMGSFSKEAHERMVRLAQRCGLNALVLVGRQMKRAGLKVLPKSTRNVWFFDGAAEAGLFLRRWTAKGDAVLLKGSRGMRLEKVQENF